MIIKISFSEAHDIVRRKIHGRAKKNTPKRVQIKHQTFSSLPFCFTTGILSPLSYGEKFFIARSRAGYSQQDVANLLGVHRNTYLKIESGQSSETDVQVPEITGLRDYEICVLCRMRVKRTQSHVARLFGCSRQWLHRLESGLENPSELIRYWKELGYC